MVYVAPAERASSAGMDAHVVKPIYLRELHITLNRRLAPVTADAPRRAAHGPVAPAAASGEVRSRRPVERQVDPEIVGAGLSQFVHDLVNTIGVIMDYAALVERRVTDPSAVAYLEEMRTAAEGAVSMARHLITDEPAPPDREGEP